MKNITRESYNLSAKNYQKRFENYLPYRNQIEKFISFLPPKCRLLDIGCGPGVDAKYFVEHGSQVTGIDYSSEMIRIAKEVCLGGTFHIDDLKDISLDNTYNAVCTSFVIVYLSDEETDPFLEKLPQLLTGDKPILYLSFMADKTPGYETTSFSKYPIFFNYYDKEVIKKKLEQLGFVLISEDEQSYKEPDGSITTDVS